MSQQTKQTQPVAPEDKGNSQHEKNLFRINQSKHKVFVYFLERVEIPFANLNGLQQKFPYVKVTKHTRTIGEKGAAAAAKESGSAAKESGSAGDSVETRVISVAFPVKEVDSRIELPSSVFIGVRLEVRETASAQDPEWFDLQTTDKQFEKTKFYKHWCSTLAIYWERNAHRVREHVQRQKDKRKTLDVMFDLVGSGVGARRQAEKFDERSNQNVLRGGYSTKDWKEDAEFEGEEDYYEPTKPAPLVGTANLSISDVNIPELSEKKKKKNRKNKNRGPRRYQEQIDNVEQQQQEEEEYHHAEKPVERRQRVSTYSAYKKVQQGEPSNDEQSAQATPTVLRVPKFTKIGELQKQVKNVNSVIKIVSTSQSPTGFLEAVVGDETGCVTFITRDIEHMKLVCPGTTLVVRNGFVNFKGCLQVDKFGLLQPFSVAQTSISVQLSDQFTVANHNLVVKQ